MVQAKGILEKIKRSQVVEYDRVTINGDLDLSKQDLKTKHIERSLWKVSALGLEENAKVVASPIRITNSRVKGITNFDGIIFQESVNFEGANFDGDANFEGALFCGEANFLNAQFTKNANFRNVHFTEDASANFEGALFCGEANFLNAQFIKDANFGNVHFIKDANFGDVDFRGKAIFGGIDKGRTHFSGSAIFMASSFRGEADFGWAQFSKYANFGDAKFIKDVSFLAAQFSESAIFWGINRGTQFKRKANFREARFNRGATFSSGIGRVTQFNGEADFSSARFSEYVNFDRTKFDKDLKLEQTKIYKMLIRAVFGDKSKILLKDSDYTKLNVRWNDIKDYLEYDGASYLALVKNFKNLEQFDDADDCYYQYRKIKQAKKKLYSKKEGWNWSKPIDIVAWLSCGYGVRPCYTILFSVLLIFIFGFLFWILNFIGDFSLFEITPANLSDVISQLILSFFNALYLSARVFILGDWRDLHGLYSYVALIEAFSRWLISALLIIVLTKKLLR